MTDFNVPSPAGRFMLRGKIHGAHLTGADLHYEGSCGIDRALLDACDILPGEQVEIYNINNGARFTTYTIAEQPGSGKITLNGSAARMAVLGDALIICTYTLLDNTQAQLFHPRIVLLDAKNHIKATHLP